MTEVGLSFVGLLRRTKLTRPWLIADKFPAGQRIFLDSGGYTVNGSPDKYGRTEIEELADKYRRFVEANLDAVEMVSELDAVGMGPDWIARQRSEFWDGLGEKFLPIWHADTGLAELERLADSYGRVGVPQTSAGGRDIAGILNRLARRGVRIHGVALTKIDLMESIGFDSVASTSWLSVAQYGDSQIWTGHELKRYPKKYKAQGRKRHRAHLDRLGFDTEAYEADDTTESLRVAVWSWQQLVGHINRRSQKVLTMSPDQVPTENPEVDPTEVGAPSEEVRNSPPTRREGERQLLPGLSLATVTRVELGEDGEKVETTDRMLGVASEAVLACDTCYLAARCPAFHAGSSCAYEIPVEVRTRDQLQAVQDAVLGMQTQRVAFMRLVEQSEGGYADPNLTKELALLDQMIKNRVEADTESVSISVKARGRAGAESGVVARLFGKEASEQARALEAPRPSFEVAQELGIVDADVVE
ncbi:hypothetical protein [Microbispora sp. NPDC049633]|uniref:hypothetical protein n=1 Tax=Microbispora sp. NPDC049633 TaxID=3154355 RepID=UPI003415D4F1